MFETKDDAVICLQKGQPMQHLLIIELNMGLPQIRTAREFYNELMIGCYS